MPKKIKLENIQMVQVSHPQHKLLPKQRFCSECGEEVSKEDIVEEYVCEQCRSLVGKNDKFCWYCGGRLGQSTVVEHYHKGEKLSKAKFKERKAQLRVFLSRD